MKVLPLESLRGIAAIIIVMLHFKNDSIWHKNLFILNSEIFVDFFFVLSGFVITLSYASNINNFNNLIFFIKKRFLRLYPLHILTLIFFVFFNLFKIYLLTKNNMEANHGVYNFFDFLKNIFLLHGFSGSSFNLPSWSISVEFYTYLVFGLLLLTKLFFRMTIPIIVLASLVIYFQSTGYIAKDYMNLTRCLFCFFLGCLAYEHRNTFAIAEYSEILFLISSFVSILSIVLFKQFIFLLAPPLFLIVILSAFHLNKLSSVYKVLTLKFFVFLGSISYGIYMIHFCITIPLRHVLHFIFGYKIDENGFLLLGNLQGFIFYILIFFLCLLLSFLSFKYLESKWKIKKI